MEHYQVVGQNNRNLLVQLKKVAPYHEDITRVQPFEPSLVYPGQYTKIKMDFKHATDREIILNDLRLRFDVTFPSGGASGAPSGRILCCRGTDLIRELTIKINEDIVFKVDKQGELSFLWEMNNHRLLGEHHNSNHAHLLNFGNIPQGHVPCYFRDTSGNTTGWNLGIAENHVSTGTEAPDIRMEAYGADTATSGTQIPSTTSLTQPGEERHDGCPRVFYDPVNSYVFNFNISFNQICGPIFHKLKMRRVEYVQVELMFEPFIDRRSCRRFLMFERNADYALAVHPWSVATIKNLQVQQYRTTLLDGTHGFTLCDSKMLSWLGNRYSRKEYTWDFANNQLFLDIQLHDWEIRTNITRIYWMLAPRDTNLTSADTTLYDVNEFFPLGENGDYEYMYAFEIRWKNDVVLDLANTYDVYRHYVLSENKRHHFEDPFIRFARLTTPDISQATAVVKKDGTVVANSVCIQPEKDNRANTEVVRWKNSSGTDKRLPRGDKSWCIGARHYEFPIYHADLNMNILYGVPGTETIGGIVNDTSDYIIRLKRPTDRTRFINNTARKVWVYLEYQTLVNLSGGSNQFNRASQVITKQLNPQ